MSAKITLRAFHFHLHCWKRYCTAVALFLTALFGIRAILSTMDRKIGFLQMVINLFHNRSCVGHSVGPLLFTSRFFYSKLILNCWILYGVWQCLLFFIYEALLVTLLTGNLIFLRFISLIIQQKYINSLYSLLKAGNAARERLCAAVITYH